MKMGQSVHMWTPEDFAELDKMHARGRTQRAMAAHFMVTIRSIESALRRLHKRKSKKRPAQKIQPPQRRRIPSPDDVPATPIVVRGSEALPPGHPATWKVITKGTLLDGLAYPNFGDKNDR